MSGSTVGSGAGDPRFEEVAENVFAFHQPDGGWCVSNAGVVVGSGTTVVVDTAATVDRAERLRAGVDARSPARAATTVVNTHMHSDHTFGNCVFAPDATFVAHELARGDMDRIGLGLQQLWPEVHWGDVRLTLPQSTFSERMTLHTGDVRVELLHFGTAHTTGDVVAWLPAQRVLFTGDLAMNGVTPFCLMGSVSGSLAAIDSLRALDPLTVVPGHGRVGGPDMLDVCADYLRWIQELAADGVSAGLTPTAVAQEAGLGGWSDLLDSERIVPNLVRAYAEQLGAPPGAAIDEMEAFRQMVEFHGGLPACHA